jgi:hypothetical protein
MRSKLIVLLVCFTALGIKCSLINAQTFRLFAVSDMVRVFEDGYNLPAFSDTLKLFGIRGETVSGQIAINSKKSLPGATVEISSLNNQVSGSVLPLNNVMWNFVGSVPLAKNASNQPKNVVIRLAPAKFPDYLMNERQLDIKENTYQPVWLTVDIPETAAAGIYSGKITVSGASVQQSIPVSLMIYPLTLPAERHLKVTEWYSTKDFSKFHGIKDIYSPEWFAMLKKYAENMAAHRQNVFEVPMAAVEIRKSATGGLEFDFSRFDQIASVFWDTKKMDWLETGEVAKFGTGAFASTEILLKDFQVLNSQTGEKIAMKGEEVYPFLLPAFEGHLRQKGWLDKTLFHIKDEPSHHNALNWINVSSYIHNYAPDLKRIDAVTTSFLFGNIEIAVPKLDHLDAGYDIYRREQQKGNEIWFYTVGVYQGNKYPNKTIDMPLIDSRILHWLNYKYDLPGYLHWGWNQWNETPFTDVGEHVGDAWHVYPVKDGVLNSIRWEQMRNGIQDYEYFWMLENKISSLKDSLGSRFGWIDPRQRGKEIISTVAMGLKDHSDDPLVLLKAKKDVINEILNLNTSPKIYIQTNPPEHGTVENRAVVELIGWTEPGTEITVNGNKLPVNRDGIFMERYLVFVGDKLQVKAQKGGNEKVITRLFNVIY